MNCPKWYVIEFPVSSDTVHKEADCIRNQRDRLRGIVAELLAKLKSLPRQTAVSRNYQEEADEEELLRRAEAAIDAK